VGKIDLHHYLRKFYGQDDDEEISVFTISDFDINVSSHHRLPKSP
jgi:hypothetical protein